MKIFVCIESYLPGTLGGGPVRALANLIDHLHAEHKFFIFTRNHDYLDATEYADLEPNVWHEQTKASVYYSNRPQPQRDMLEQIQSVQPDWIYLNGALPQLTRSFLRLRRQASAIQEIPVLLAPHGNLSASALAHHRIRKQGWLFFAKARGYYNGLIWHAASDREADQIRDCFGSCTEIRIVPMAPRLARSEREEWEVQRLKVGNLERGEVAKFEGEKVGEFKVGEVETCGADTTSQQPTITNNNTLSLVYFGRLSPEKNLEFAFQLLGEFAAKYPHQQIVYDLIGAGEPRYKAKLRSIADKLPQTVQINFIGQLSPEALQARLYSSFIIHHSSLPKAASRYHALLMPSLTENFSYTVLESLQAGIPVLISDQTPWRDLEMTGVGWDISLHAPAQWLNALEQLSDTVSQVDRSERAIHYAAKHSAGYSKVAKQLFTKD